MSEHIVCDPKGYETFIEADDAKTSYEIMNGVSGLEVVTTKMLPEMLPLRAKMADNRYYVVYGDDCFNGHPPYVTNPKMQQHSRHDIDQTAALIRDTMPSLWYGLYCRLQEEGFTEQQAMELLKTYVISSHGTHKNI